jgi:hypothetical protein
MTSMHIEHLHDLFAEFWRDSMHLSRSERATALAELTAKYFAVARNQDAWAYSASSPGRRCRQILRRLRCTQCGAEGLSHA